MKQSLEDPKFWAHLQSLPQPFPIFMSVDWQEAIRFATGSQIEASRIRPAPTFPSAAAIAHSTSDDETAAWMLGSTTVGATTAEAPAAAATAVTAVTATAATATTTTAATTTAAAA